MAPVAPRPGAGPRPRGSSPRPIEVEGHPDAPEDPYERYRVERLRLDSNERELRYNDRVTVRNLPEAAFQRRPAGYPPLEWIARFWRAAKKVDGPPKHRILWNPNQALRERKNPRYLLELTGRAVRVGVVGSRFLWVRFPRPTARPCPRSA